MWGGIEAQASTGVGEVVYVRGAVSIERGRVIRTLYQGHTVLRNDVIVTGDGGRVKLRMADGTKVYVGSKSRLGLKDYTMKQGNLLNASFHMLWGRARFFVHKLTSRRSHFRVRTSTAVLGVRGTSILAEVNRVTGATNFTLMTGAAAIAPIDTQGRVLPPRLVVTGETAKINPHREMIVVKADAASMAQANPEVWVEPTSKGKPDSKPAPVSQPEKTSKTKQVAPPASESKPTNQAEKPKSPSKAVPTSKPKTTAQTNEVAKLSTPKATANASIAVQQTSSSSAQAVKTVILTPKFDANTLAQNVAKQAAQQSTQYIVPSISSSVSGASAATTAASSLQQNAQTIVQQTTQQVFQNVVQSQNSAIQLNPKFVLP